jgi:hypothetical protein
MKNIYLPNKGAHDYSKANCFGNFVTITEGPIKLTGVGFLYRRASYILKDSSPNDYILLCGPTIANIIVCGVFAVLHNRLNLLIYKSTSAGDRYYERTIVFENLNNMEDQSND